MQRAYEVVRISHVECIADACSTKARAMCRASAHVVHPRHARRVAHATTASMTRVAHVAQGTISDDAPAAVTQKANHR